MCPKNVDVVMNRAGSCTTSEQVVGGELASIVGYLVANSRR
jgi:hypothetical protein